MDSRSARTSFELWGRLVDSWSTTCESDPARLVVLAARSLEFRETRSRVGSSPLGALPRSLGRDALIAMGVLNGGVLE